MKLTLSVFITLAISSSAKEENNCVHDCFDNTDDRVSLSKCISKCPLPNKSTKDKPSGNKRDFMKGLNSPNKSNSKSGSLRGTARELPVSLHESYEEGEGYYVDDGGWIQNDDIQEPSEEGEGYYVDDGGWSWNQNDGFQESGHYVDDGGWLHNDDFRESSNGGEGYFVDDGGWLQNDDNGNARALNKADYVNKERMRDVVINGQWYQYCRVVGYKLLYCKK